MSFIRDPCNDGTQCYNQMAKSSFGTECIDETCKVLEGNACTHDVDCAFSDSDIDKVKCLDEKCTTTTCNCQSYEECGVDYKCKPKSCSSTPDCIKDKHGDGSGNGNVDASFCFQNICRPLASFGGQCGVSSDCGEKGASCINGICGIEEEQSQGMTHSNNNDDGKSFAASSAAASTSSSSFGNGFIAGFLVASFCGFAIYVESKTNYGRDLTQNLVHRIRYGNVAVVEGQVVSDVDHDSDGRVTSAHIKQIQLSAIM